MLSLFVHISVAERAPKLPGEKSPWIPDVACVYIRVLSCHWCDLQSWAWKVALFVFVPVSPSRFQQRNGDWSRRSLRPLRPRSPAGGLGSWSGAVTIKTWVNKQKKNNTSCVRNVKMWGMSNNKYFVALAIRPEPGFNYRIICFGEKSNWTLANRHPVKSHP